MKISIPLSAVMLGSVAVSLASPMTPWPIIRRDDGEVGEEVAGIGPCPTDCWNEAAVEAQCDPNEDDDCLCGPFFDAVTTCVSQTCDIEENLVALDFLEPACN